MRATGSLCPDCRSPLFCYGLGSVALLKWSRVRLIVSILTAEGLFATLRERLQVGPAPPSSGAPQPVPAPTPRQEQYDYAGALHIHSTYSDGVGTMEQIAQAAGKAGLDFIVMCDHSNLDVLVNHQDGWQGRTLVLAGTEITTDTGHLLALNVPPSFVPAPGSAVEAQQAIRTAGGIGFIALPCDLKDHWRNFALHQPGIGLEVFNLSAIARTKISLPGLLLVWLRYNSPRRLKAFHLVAARPARELALWDRLMLPLDPGGPSRPVVGIASLDAHAVMRFGGRSYPYPTYEESFRTLRTHVVTARPLSRDPLQAANDARQVHAALAQGHCFIAYDNYADARGFRFEALPSADAPSAQMGDTLTPGNGGVRLQVQAPSPNALVRLFHNGVVVAAARGGRLSFQAHAAGAYRVEVYLYRFHCGDLCFGAKPWIFSNPIYVQPVSAAVELMTETAFAPEHSASVSSRPA